MNKLKWINGDMASVTAFWHSIRLQRMRILAQQATSYCTVHALLLDSGAWLPAVCQEVHLTEIPHLALLLQKTTDAIVNAAANCVRLYPPGPCSLQVKIMPPSTGVCGGMCNGGPHKLLLSRTLNVAWIIGWS